MARTLLVSLFGMAFVMLSGCKSDGPDVVRQKVKHIEQAEKNVIPGEKDRLLALLVTDKDKAWSFKLSGPEAAVALHKEKFNEFLKTIKMGDEPPLRWTVPEGWKELPGDKDRYRTLKTSADQNALELTVFLLSQKGGDVLLNVNRWRGQLGLPPATAEQLPDMAKEIDIDGRKGTVVDLVGKFAGKGKMPPMMPPLQPKLPGPGKISYDLPAGWVKAKPKNTMIQEQFDVTDGKDKAEATIVFLPGNAGGDDENIQRWRGQIQLPRAKNPEELLKEFTRIETKAGHAGLVDLKNPDIAGINRILGAIVPTPNGTYFLKMMGPSDLLGREKDRFEAFAKSLSLE